MRVLGSIALLYYAFGVFMLQGDFNVIGRISAMYAHCKATEDKDMQWMDFVTDHLVCFDALVDGHPPGDDQRPHRSLPTKEYATSGPVLAINEQVPSSHVLVVPAMVRNYPGEVDLYHFDPVALVFRPPNA